MGAIVGQKSMPFLLCEATSAKRLGDGTWQYDIPHKKDDNGGDDLDVKPISNKFVYIFRSSNDRDDADFFMELQADASGNLTMLQGSETGAIKSNHLSLLFQVGNKLFFHQFFVTRFRLDSPGAIEKLGAAISARKELPRFFFGEWSMVIPMDVQSGPVTDGPTSSLTDAYMPVVDALTIAASLHTDYRISCDGLMGFIAPPGDLPFPTEEGRIRNKKLLIAHLLESLVEANRPTNKLKLSGMFAGDGTGSTVKAFIKNVDDNVKNGIRYRDIKGATLCFWIDGSLVKGLEDAYDVTFDGKGTGFTDTYVEFLNWRRDFESRLCESAPGRLYLQELASTPDTEYRTFVLLEDSAKEKFEVAEKVKGFVTASWMQMIPAIIGRRPVTITPTKLTQMLGRVTHVKIPDPVSRTVKMPPAKPGGPVRKVVIEGVALTEETKKELGAWFSEEGDVAKGAKQVSAVFALLSVAFAFGELKEANTDAEKIQAGVALTGAVGETAAATLEVFEVAEASAKFLGAFASVVALFNTSAATGKALAFKDYGGAIGDGIQVFGSGLVALAATLGAFSAESGATIVGIPAGIVAAIGAALCLIGGVVVSLFHDTDLQKMVKFSAFGKDPKGSPEKPKWSPVAFDQWNDGAGGLEKQIDAMFNLLGAFSVQPADYTTIRIFPGLTGPSSRFVVTFEGTFSPLPGLKRQTTLEYDCTAKTLTKTGGDEVDLDGATFESTDGDGRPFTSIEFKYKFAGNDGLQTLATSCDVRLALDDEKQVPEKDPLHCDVYVLDALPALRGEVFSKDVE